VFIESATTIRFNAVYGETEKGHARGHMNTLLESQAHISDKSFVHYPAVRDSAVKERLD
jgi:hypothetical protein